MSQNTTAQGLLILMVPLSLEEMLVDMLLQQTEISGFTTTDVSGHGSRHIKDATPLSLVEQVAGRQKRVQFMMHASFAALQNLITELKQSFDQAGLHYILVPIADAQSI